MKECKNDKEALAVLLAGRGYEVSYSRATETTPIRLDCRNMCDNIADALDDARRVDAMDINTPSINFNKGGGMWIVRVSVWLFDDEMPHGARVYIGDTDETYTHEDEHTCKCGHNLNSKGEWERNQCASCDMDEAEAKLGGDR
ncbi:MAG: hypothetical protein GY851_09290 [bacterium]|nr:hypothetical protein [bacterium]